jgi:cytochrome c5
MRRLSLLVMGVAVLFSAACSQPEAMIPADQAAVPAATRMDALLLASAKIALPPAGFTAADLPEPDSQGARLMVENCTQCHELPTPGAHSATDWPRVLRRMWIRMDELPDSLGVKTLAEGERTRVSQYLMANALQVSDADLPPGPGKADFEAICSRCHALPDIKIHSSQDWPSVYMRMERNMERMNVRPATQEQTSRILLYLQEAESAK